MREETPPDPISLNWTQTVEHARHWEALLFENAKNYFTIIAAAIGAAGAVMAWSIVPRTTQITVICFFLLGAAFISVCAICTVRSTQRYLNRLYKRRRELEKNGGLKLIAPPQKPGRSRTVHSLNWAFIAAIILTLGLLVLVLTTPEIERLDLSGGDLSLARNLTQSDLEGACGDATTKLPPGLVLSSCAP